MTKIFIKTFGSATNKADSEQMKGLLKQAEFEIINTIDNADLVIINSCSLNQKKELEIKSLIENIKETYKIVIIAGCLAQLQSKEYQEFSLIGTKQINNIVEVVEEALNNNTVRCLMTNELPELNTSIIRNNDLIEIIPITRGYLNQCNFCKLKSEQDTLQSYSVEDIIKRANKAIQDGVKQIWLTSQDTANYGFDINTNLPILINQITNIPSDFRVRIGMMTPHNLQKIQTELIESYKNPKIFKFLHLPINSGNNNVLKNMKLNYNIEDFDKQVLAFRRAIPNISVMTDVIVGFPSETPQQFFNTITLLRKTSPDYTNVSKFENNSISTELNESEIDEGMVEENEIKRRFRVTNEVSQNIALLAHEKWHNWVGEIILTKKDKHTNQFIGYTPSYTQVAVAGDYKLGQKLNVKITKTGIYGLIGEKESKNSLKSEENVVKLQIVND